MNALFLLKLYLLTVPVFFGVDLIWLGVVAKGFYRRHLDFILSPHVNWPAAITFYLIYIIGIIVFAVVPAIGRGSLMHALVWGWNFLSEEFLEYIGSSFQDFFQIAIKTKDGVNNLILVKSIDDLANEFGATKEPENPGNLISVTPPIDFGNHGVYMTDWQTFTYDLNAYKDQIVTLIFAVGDVGDSAFDTAVLLDSITIE